MFQKDDYVFYGSGGICRVFDICYAPLRGMPADRQYYILHSFHDPSGVMYIPVQNAAAFLRPLLTREEAETLLNGIPDVTVIEEPNPKILKTRYMESMRTHDPVEWVRVIKTVQGRVRKLAAAPRSGRISDTERSFADDAKRYLYTELSLALGIPARDMERYLQSRGELLA